MNCIEMAHRSFREECSFIERLNNNSFLIKKGFVPNMKVGNNSFPAVVIFVIIFVQFTSAQLC